MKDFYCPFCLERYGSRMFLNNIHVPKCKKREDYFNKILDPREMEEIYQRIHGNVELDQIELQNFKGSVIKE